MQYNAGFYKFGVLKKRIICQSAIFIFFLIDNDFIIVNNSAELSLIYIFKKSTIILRYLNLVKKSF